MSRDQGRTPVQWDASPGAGFTSGTPWIAINPDHVEVNAAAQVGEPASVFEHYRQLIELRHTDLDHRRRLRAAAAPTTRALGVRAPRPRR